MMRAFAGYHRNLYYLYMYWSILCFLLFLFSKAENYNCFPGTVHILIFVDFSMQRFTSASKKIQIQVIHMNIQLNIQEKSQNTKLLALREKVPSGVCINY